MAGAPVTSQFMFSTATLMLGPMADQRVLNPAAHSIGLVKNVQVTSLRVISQGEAGPRHLVICGHGDETGLVFGDYGEGIDTSALEQGSMPPAAIAARARLPGRIVVSTACATGSKAFGEAFLAGGAAAYLAPQGYPEGADAGLFVHLLFDRMLRKRAPPAAALRAVRDCDAAFATFTLFPAS